LRDWDKIVAGIFVEGEAGEKCSPSDLADDTSTIKIIIFRVRFVIGPHDDGAMGIGAVIYWELPIVMINYFNKKAAGGVRLIDTYTKTSAVKEEPTDWILDVWASSPCGKKGSHESITDLT